MNDYTELIKALRVCVVGLCEVCPYDGKNEERLCADGLRMDAADAIEELQKCLNGVCADNDALCEHIESLCEHIEALKNEFLFRSRPKEETE